MSPQIAWFEIRFWLRSWVPWVCLFVIGLLSLGATSSAELMAELNLANTHRNAPFAIAVLYAGAGVFTLLMTAVFVNFAALRDFSCNTHQLILATPVRRRDLLLGRFLGATLVSAIPMLGVSCGILAARYMPWADPERWAAVNWTAHLQGFLLFAAPDVFLTAAFLFAVAVAWRREMASFVAAILLVTGRALSNQLLQDERWEHLRALLDPFGGRAFALASKYWTVADKDSLSASVGGILLGNRLLWIGAGCAALAIAFSRFGLARRPTKSRPPAPAGQPGMPPAPSPAPLAQLRHRPWAKLAGSFWIHFRAMATSAGFGVLAMIAGGICILSLATGATRFEGNETYEIFPVTYAVIDLLRGSLGLFLIIILAYFAGALVWKDREARFDGIADTAPAPDWVSYAARLAALLGLVMVIQVVAAIAGIAVQALHGYHHFQLGLYLYELLVRDMSGLACWAILAFFIQALATDKYVAYAGFVAVYCANAYLWPAVNVVSHLARFAGRPGVLYSDFFGAAPYRLAWNWFTLYWLLICSLLGIVTVLFWPRGRQQRWRARARLAALRFGAGWKAAALAALVALGACGGWIWYNTAVLNTLSGPQDLERIQADYEKTYRRWNELPQPRLRRVRYAIDLDPASRNVVVRGAEVVANPYAKPLAEIHFSLDQRYDTTIEVPGTELAGDDARLAYRRYRFTPPLRPGEERTLRFSVKSRNRGFENNASNLQIVSNGTFLSNLGGLVTGAHYLAPIVGYDSWRELSDAAERRRYGLHQIDLMPALQRVCVSACRDTYLPGHADWVDASAVISTPPDQIAVAPGSLVRQWREGGRRYFEYRLDHPSPNLYFFAAGRYEVARAGWHGLQLEVYHLREHAWNVARMMEAMKASLAYYRQNFGPYPHRQARIVEFPRVAAFAAAFPGTVAISESFGFLANLDHAGDVDIVSYVVAHEMAHQWWDEQVIGANMEGATLLSETLAQYSALMVMEKQYGQDMVRRLLRYNADLYLSSRGQERQQERPLLRVEYRQFYVFYQKGAVALYCMKEMIGEEAVNRALRQLIRHYAYAPPPYPTSYALVDALRAETPPYLRYLVQDLFEDITLFSNRALTAYAVKRADGRYEVTLDVEARKFKADATGRESEVPVDDWIDIGAFAKPAAGRPYGETLYRDRRHIRQRRSTVTFTTAQIPERAGIDPFGLLIERLPDDNLKTVTLR